MPVSREGLNKKDFSMAPISEFQAVIPLLLEKHLRGKKNPTRNGSYLFTLCRKDTVVYITCVVP